jgi:hypothetical protein
VTTEEIGKLTNEEAVQAFFDLRIKVAETNAAYEAAKLRLIEMLTDPNLTDERREAIRAALMESSI